MAKTEHRESSAQNGQTLAKHDLLRESIAEKCEVLRCIRSPTISKVWPTKVRGAKKSGRLLGIRKMRSLFDYMVCDG